MDGNDLRIAATPVLIRGTIYAGWGTGTNNGTQVAPSVEWAQIDLGRGGPSTTTGYFTLSADNAPTYPAFMPDGDGNVVMVYEHTCLSSHVR